jgi:hypothetical protein
LFSADLCCHTLYAEVCESSSRAAKAAYSGSASGVCCSHFPDAATENAGLCVAAVVAAAPGHVKDFSSAHAQCAVMHDNWRLVTVGGFQHRPLHCLEHRIVRRTYAVPVLDGRTLGRAIECSLLYIEPSLRGDQGQILSPEAVCRNQTLALLFFSLELFEAGTAIFHPRKT